MNMDDINYLNGIDVRIINANSIRDHGTALMLENTRNAFLAKKGYNPAEFTVGCYLQNQPPPVAYTEPPIQQGYGVYQPQPTTLFARNSNPGFFQPAMNTNMQMSVGTNTTMMGSNVNTKTIECLYPDNNSNQQNATNAANENVVEPTVIPRNKIPFCYATAVGITPERKVSGGYYEIEFNGKALLEKYDHKIENITIENDNDYIKQCLDILTYSNNKRNVIYRVNTHKKFLCVGGGENLDMKEITGYDRIMKWCGSGNNPLISILASIMSKEQYNTIKYRTMYHDYEFKPITNPVEFMASLKDGSFSKKSSNGSDRKYIQTVINFFDKFFSTVKIVKAEKQYENIELKDLNKELYEFKIPVTKYFAYSDQIIEDFKDNTGNTIDTVAVDEFSHEVIYNLLEGSKNQDALFTYLVIDSVSYRVLKYNDTFILNKEV